MFGTRSTRVVCQDGVRRVHGNDFYGARCSAFGYGTGDTTMDSSLAKPIWAVAKPELGARWAVATPELGARWAVAKPELGARYAVAKPELGATCAAKP